MFFPILAVWIRFKSARWRVYALCIAMLASLGVSEYLALTDVSSAFYLPYSRFWELLLGSLIATRIVSPPRNLFIRELLAALGLAIIAAAVLTYGNVTAFPGLAALAPCMGTAVIIWSGASDQTITGRALAWPPFRICRTDFLFPLSLALANDCFSTCRTNRSHWTVSDAGQGARRCIDFRACVPVVAVCREAVPARHQELERQTFARSSDGEHSYMCDQPWRFGEGRMASKVLAGEHKVSVLSRL